MTKRSPKLCAIQKVFTKNNIPKQEKNMFTLNVFLIRFLHWLINVLELQGMVELYYIKAIQMFYKIGVLKNVAKFTEKHLCWRCL